LACPDQERSCVQERFFQVPPSPDRAFVESVPRPGLDDLLVSEGKAAKKKTFVDSEAGDPNLRVGLEGAGDGDVCWFNGGGQNVGADRDDDLLAHPKARLDMAFVFLESLYIFASAILAFTIAVEIIRFGLEGFQPTSRGFPYNNLRLENRTGKMATERARQGKDASSKGPGLEGLMFQAFHLSTDVKRSVKRSNEFETPALNARCLEAFGLEADGSKRDAGRAGFKEARQSGHSHTDGGEVFPDSGSPTNPEAGIVDLRPSIPFKHILSTSRFAELCESACLGNGQPFHHHLKYSQLPSGFMELCESGRLENATLNYLPDSQDSVNPDTWATNPGSCVNPERWWDSPHAHYVSRLT
ncbi:hypothetical protein BD779DRAFT_1480903, partial [Infundibulicybe gibba]